MYTEYFFLFIFFLLSLIFYPHSQVWYIFTKLLVIILGPIPDVKYFTSGFPMETIELNGHLSSATSTWASLKSSFWTKRWSKIIIRMKYPQQKRSCPNLSTKSGILECCIRRTLNIRKKRPRVSKAARGFVMPF
jgi:hypothetical protein